MRVVDRLTRWVLAHRRLVALAWIAVTAAGMWAAATISDSLSQSFTAPGRPAFEANEEIVRTFGTGGVVPPVVLVTQTADPNEAARRFERVARAVDGARVALPGDRGAGALVSDDGRTAAALVFPPPGRLAPDTNPQAVAALTAAAAGTGVSVTGVDALNEDTGGGGTGVLVETILGGAGALVVLVAVFASLAALVPMLIAAVSILGSFLALRALAAVTEVSFVVQFIVALIGLGVAIDYSLLVVVRWREERERGADPHDAINVAMATAGRAVVFSGTTVAVGLLALVVVPVPAIRSIGYGGLLIPLVSVAAATTLLPALLLSAGRRLDWPAARRAPSESRRWRAWSAFVVRRRWPAVITGIALLAVLVGFATTLNPGSPTVDALSSGGAPKAALDRLEASGLGSGLLTPVEVVLPTDGASAAAQDFDGIAGVHGVLEPAGRAWERDGRSLLTVIPVEDAGTDPGAATLDGVRSAAERIGAGAGGPAAQTADLTDAIYGSFVPMFALIAVITFVLLGRAFRSVVLPLKALALNVLSVGAAFGIIVIVWQDGHGSELFGITATGAITNWVPLAMFAFLFGLSMDYEVFILSRMRESYDQHRDTDRAVVDGLGATGRLVTSAALILFLAFVALGAAPGTELKIFATGLAAGIILDATVVRALIVPSLVTLFGRANWWLPRPLARALRLRPVGAAARDADQPA
jgi:RND superfamily putative drug exporter